MLNEMMRLEMNVSEYSHYMGAQGASLFALDHILGSLVPVSAEEERS